MRPRNRGRRDSIRATILPKSSEGRSDVANDEKASDMRNESREVGKAGGNSDEIMSK